MNSVTGPAARGDPRPARRPRRAAAGPAPAGARRSDPLGEGAVAALRHRPLASAPDATVADALAGAAAVRGPRHRAARRRRSSTSDAIAADAPRDGAARRAARRPRARRHGLARRRRRRLARGAAFDLMVDAGPRVRSACCEHGARGRHAEPAQRAARRRSTSRTSTRRAACGSPPRSASTATSPRRRRRSSPRASTCSSSTRRTATRRACSRRRRASCATSGSACRSSRATSSPPTRVADLVEAGADIAQGRRRPRRHVHDPHDDRGRAAAVLRGARDGRGGARARRARVGRRRSALPARRRARARRGRGIRDDRLVVRGHHRGAGRRCGATHPAGSTRRAGAWPRRRRCTSASIGSTPYELARKELFAEGISSSKIYLDPLRPSLEDLLDMITSGVRSSFTYAGARSIAEFRERALVGIQSAAGLRGGQGAAGQLVTPRRARAASRMRRPRRYTAGDNGRSLLCENARP